MVEKKSPLQELEDRFYPWLNDRARDCSATFAPDANGEQVSSDLDSKGRELPDDVPMAPPVGYSVGPSLADFVQRMIRTEVSRHAAEASYETFEESEDFEIDDDPLDPTSVLSEYEEVFRNFNPPKEAPIVAPSKSDASASPKPADEVSQKPEPPSKVVGST